MGYTPSPWSWELVPGTNEPATVAEWTLIGPDVLCRYWFDKPPSADACLISAAPDLLAALQSLVADIRDYERVNNLAPSPGKEYCWQSVGVAYAAIDKATGTNS